MNLKQIKEIFLKELSQIYDKEEIERFFFMLLENFHQMKRIDYVLHSTLEIEKENTEKWNSALENLKQQKPIQYIINEAEFYGLPFYVNEFTLIPRPETEELVDWIIKDENKRLTNLKNKNISVLDIGTGSGCIAICLKKNIENAEVYALDVSDDALKVTQKNAQLNKVSIHLLNENILTVNTLNNKFDVIVSNPPYVRYLEKIEIKPNVLNYEPHLALFVSDDDALIFYRKIAQLAIKYLNTNGSLYFEINQYLSEEMFKMLKDLGYKNIELRKDLFGNFRMIKAKL